MSKKFFTLIHGDQVRLAPNQKVIPAAVLSKLQDASEVLDHVHEDVKRYRLQVAGESEEIKENAYKEGYEKGYEDWAEELVHFQKQHDEYQKELKKMILPIALKAAKKIVGREIELSKDAIVDIVITNLKSVRQHKKILIYVNKNDIEALEKNKPRIKELFENLENLSIRPRDDIERGGCMIETEVGIINAQLEHRWQVLEKAFEKLIQNTPETLKDN